MRVHLMPVVVFVAVAAAAAQAPPMPVPFTVHEWGTFTSIAADDGGAVSWLPQGGQSDLPCFVEHTGYCVKCSLWGTVRMETPVLYFYAPRQVYVDVKVGFEQGTITEWYPRALVGSNGQQGPDARGTIAWSDITVSPQLVPAFPTESGASHYYKAAQHRRDPAPVAIANREVPLLPRRRPVRAANRRRRPGRRQDHGVDQGGADRQRDHVREPQGGGRVRRAPRGRLARHARPAVAGGHDVHAAA